jgi:phospholipid/cholesterol/gamma-HCH transport system substrate-binding protein
METDKHYFIVGLFILGIAAAAALFAIWLTTSGERDDVLYRINFSESVSGLSLGDSVKYLGVDVGTVKAMGIDPADPRRVRVDVQLRKDTPVKTDTKAVLTMKGLTGVVFIELSGGKADAKDLLAATPADQVPEIASEKSPLKQVLDDLPKVVAKFSTIESQFSKVLGDVGAFTSRFRPKPDKSPPRKIELPPGS